jgi:hypothetical protein
VFDLCFVITTAPVWDPLIGVLWLMSWLEARQGFYLDHLWVKMAARLDVSRLEQ